MNCEHALIEPNGDCIFCGRLATTMPGDAEGHVMIPRKMVDAVKAALRSRTAPLESALVSIANLWPYPPSCAVVNPEWVGENDGKQRAILLEAALTYSRLALDQATCPQCGSKVRAVVERHCQNEANRNRWHSFKTAPQPDVVGSGSVLK